MKQIQSELNKNQKDILDLEKEYFNLLHSLFSKDDFKNDLLNTEKYLKKPKNYKRIKNLYDKKNKIDIGFERIIRKHIYSSQSYLKMTDIYPSPISSDIAFQTEKAIINIDSKTIDSIGNKGDWRQLQFKKNQSSFINKFPGKSAFYSGCDVSCNLKMSENGKPLLTYFLSLKYTDDNNSFEIYRNDKEDNIHFTVLPNGHLSHLFDNDLIINCKTYEYKKDIYKFKKSVIKNIKKMKEKDIKNYAEANFDNFADFKKEVEKTGFEFPPNSSSINVFSRWGFMDESKKDAWLPCTMGTKDKKEVCFKSVTAGDTYRSSFDDLTDRLDSKNDPWKGHINWSI